MRALAVLVALVTCLAGAACAGPPSGPAPGDALRLGVVGLATFDPAEAGPTDRAELIAADLLFDGLTAAPGLGSAPGGGEAGAVPALAEALEPDADLVVWTVRLGERAFSDGSPVGAADVAATLERVEGPLAAVVGDVVVVDDRTVRIELVEPYAPLPEVLSSPRYGVAPAGGVGPGEGGAVVGSGPYRVAGDDGSVVRLERVGEGGGPAGVELVRFGSVEEAYDAFVRGELDWALVPTGQEGAAAERFGDGAFAPFGAALWFAFDLTEPALTDPALRRAVVHAVDRDRIAGMVPGVVPWDGLVAEGVEGALGSSPAGGCGEACRHDPALAADLVAQAFPGGAVPEVAVVGPDEPAAVAVLEAVAADLRAATIPARVRAVPADRYEAEAAGGGAGGLFRTGWVGLAPTQDAWLGPPFQAGSPDNAVGLRLDEVNGLLARARATPDRAERVATYQLLEQVLVDESVVVPVGQQRTAQVVSGRVEGFVPRLDGTFVVEDLRLAG